MAELDILIRFHKGILTSAGFLLSSSVKHIIDQTIEALEDLKKLRGGKQ